MLEGIPKDAGCVKVGELLALFLMFEPPHFAMRRIEPRLHNDRSGLNSSNAW